MGGLSGQAAQSRCSSDGNEAQGKDIEQLEVADCKTNIIGIFFLDW